MRDALDVSEILSSLIARPRPAKTWGSPIQAAGREDGAFHETGGSRNGEEVGRWGEYGEETAMFLLGS